jgi:CMP/dCMP kinase
VKIAVSGLSGSGNSTACGKIAKLLRLKAINYTFKDLAAEIGMDFYALHEKRKSDPAYDLLLDKRQIEMFEGEENAILGSRLAIWIADANLRVWLEAPIQIRAKRISQRDGIPTGDALVKTRMRDKENAAQYLRLYGIDINKHGFADIVIDSGKFGADEVAKKIASAAKSKKYAKVKKSPMGEKIRKIIQVNLNKIRC